MSLRNFWQNLQNKLRRTTYLGRALKLLWKSSRGWAIARILVLIVQGIIPLLLLYVTKQIVDTVALGMQGADLEEAFQKILQSIAIAAGLALLNSSAQTLTKLIEEVQAIAVTDRIYELLHRKAIQVELAYYENAEYYDVLHRAQSQAANIPTKILKRLSQTAEYLISVVAIASVLLAFNWAIALALTVSIVPRAIVNVYYSRKTYLWTRQRTATERKARYFSSLIATENYAKEVRLFGLGKLFERRFRTIRHQLRHERLKLATGRSLSELVTQIGALAAIWGSFAFIAYEAVQGKITIGDLVMYRGIFQRGYMALLNTMYSLAGLYEDNLFLANLYEFLDIEPAIADPPEPKPFPKPIQKGICFEGVSFDYPNSKRRALDRVDLHIAPGEVIALVGENGSGKTTLIKLLCRLYDPTEGRITVDNYNLQTFSLTSLRREIGVIFQDYAKYHLSVLENIWFGSAHLVPRRDRIVAAAKRAGAHEVICRLPQEYDTLLGKQFERGEELSIGQWQKIALARAFLRDSQVIVLDEPTSALDPKAEYEVFKKFRELLQNQSAVLITHRLSTVRMADRIYVLERGKLVEAGPHEELMRLGGTYARMFETQASNYR